MFGGFRGRSIDFGDTNKYQTIFPNIESKYFENLGRKEGGGAE